nr:MAG: hypothetical protein [Aspergillus flavus partitivirus 1]BED98290.1 MAG: hypothetical protein [Aspergillus flavus partitivirus 1]BED98329.1 MAG: hypothetical protein [Aspergillus flavus partitivirus 1]
MAGKIENWKLHDGTIVAVQEKDMVAAKKFGQYQYFFGILMTLFPEVRHDLLETMYIPSKMNDCPLFVRTVLAMQMIKDQYSEVPEFYFDHLHAQSEYGVYYVFVRKNKVYEYSDTVDTIMRELSVNDDAMIRVCELFRTIERVEEPIEDEPVIFVEDQSPEIQDMAHSTAYFHANAACDTPDCPTCKQLDAYLDGSLKVTKPLSTLLPVGDVKCGRAPSLRFTPNLSRLFSPVLSYEYNRIRVFGSTFKRLDCTDFSARLAQLRASDWYLCRLRWLPPEDAPDIDAEVEC